MSITYLLMMSSPLISSGIPTKLGSILMIFVLIFDRVIWLILRHIHLDPISKLFLVTINVLGTIDPTLPLDSLSVIKIYLLLNLSLK